MYFLKRGGNVEKKSNTLVKRMKNYREEVFEDRQVTFLSVQIRLSVWIDEYGKWLA